MCKKKKPNLADKTLKCIPNQIIPEEIARSPIRFKSFI